MVNINGYFIEAAKHGPVAEVSHSSNQTTHFFRFDYIHGVRQVLLCQKRSQIVLFSALKILCDGLFDLCSWDLNVWGSFIREI